MGIKYRTIKSIVRKLTATLRKDDFDLCKEQRLRPACAFVWPDVSISYSPETDMDLEKPTNIKMEAVDRLRGFTDCLNFSFSKIY